MTNMDGVLSRVKKELSDYRNKSVDLFEGHSYSAYRLIRRISLYKNEIYPTGKFDSQGQYKYFFNIVIPRVNAEIKNVDFDTSDIRLYSDAKADAGKLILANAALIDWLSVSGQGDKINEAIERGTEWGNVVWKKVKDGYRIMDLNHFMVLNQTAETLEDSDTIEEEIMSPLQLRQKAEVWDNVDKLLDQATKEKDRPEYFIYERNGEITKKELAAAQGKDFKGKDDKEYILAKIIVGGTDERDPKHILFAEDIEKKPFKEYHRGTYAGRWMRVGMYEVLFDVQTRANEIGNQLARGLEWSSKTIFTTQDKVIAQNILTDLQNGDIIKSQNGITQVQTRMEGMDQLMADWNRIMNVADALANSFEVVTGETLPSGTPFSLGALLNVNAAKLFDFLREKLGLVLQDVIEEWILPEMLKDLKGKKVLELTGDSGMLSRYYEIVVQEWYIANLLAFPPHNAEIAEEIKNEKMQELLKSDKAMMASEKKVWDGFKPRARVVITGENVNITSDLETLKTFITLEPDPIRRTALVELAMGKKNIDVQGLPKTDPALLAGVGAPAAAPEKKPTQLERVIEEAK